MHIIFEENLTGPVWFTSDHHFGHANVIRYCNRPWATVEEMDEALVQKWNSVVGKNDLVYHLGDFTLLGYNKFKEYVKRLSGIIRIVPGSHDARWLVPWRSNMHRPPISANGCEVEATDSLLTLEIEDGKSEYPQVVVLCHYAMRVWDRSHYGSIHLYGHSHGQLPGIGRSLDVGVDCWDYTPISLQQVRAIMEMQTNDNK